MPRALGVLFPRDADDLDARFHVDDGKVVSRKGNEIADHARVAGRAAAGAHVLARVANQVGRVASLGGPFGGSENLRGGVVGKAESGRDAAGARDDAVSAFPLPALLPSCSHT